MLLNTGGNILKHVDENDDVKIITKDSTSTAGNKIRIITINGVMTGESIAISTRVLQTAMDLLNDTCEVVDTSDHSNANKLYFDPFYQTLTMPPDKEPMKHGEYTTTPKRYRNAKLSPAQKLLLKQQERNKK